MSLKAFGLVVEFTELVFPLRRLCLLTDMEDDDPLQYPVMTSR
jgi:hypothetical protein